MMDQQVAFRQVPIHPIDLLYEAKDLLGEQYWLFVGITLVGVLIGSAVPMGILWGPMLCGIHLCYVRRSQNRLVEFNLLFKGFDFFVESLVAMLIMMAAFIGAMVVVVVGFAILFFTLFAGIQGGWPVEAEAAVALFVVFFYAAVFVLALLTSVPFIFVFPLIVDRGLKAVPAVQMSCHAVLENAFGVLGMMLLYGLISIVASCFCYVPAILFMPLYMGGIHLAYCDIFGAGEEIFE